MVKGQADQVVSAVRAGEDVAEGAEELAKETIDPTIKVVIDNALDNIKENIMPLIESAKKVEQAADSITF